MQDNTSLDQSLLSRDAENLERVMLRLSWASQRRLGRELEQYGLTLSQFMALRAVRRVGSEGCAMSDLASAVQQLSPTMTGIVKRLVRRGLLSRQLDPSDRRIMRVTLTEDSVSLLAQIDRRNRRRFERVLAPLNATERKEMVRLMRFYLQVVLEELGESEKQTEGELGQTQAA
jgi:DNA-binding MarR family transcriptional regulator